MTPETDALIRSLRHYHHDGDGYWKQCKYCGVYVQLKINGQPTREVLAHRLPCAVAELEDVKALQEVKS